MARFLGGEVTSIRVWIFSGTAHSVIPANSVTHFNSDNQYAFKSVIVNRAHISSI